MGNNVCFRDFSMLKTYTFLMKNTHSSWNNQNINKQKWIVVINKRITIHKLFKITDFNGEINRRVTFLALTLCRWPTGKHRTNLSCIFSMSSPLSREEEAISNWTSPMKEWKWRTKRIFQPKSFLYFGSLKSYKGCTMNNYNL